MKKALIFLLVCLSTTVMFAQSKTHWTPVLIGGDAMVCLGVLQINGEEQKNPDLEIGVFSNDGVCRSAKLPVYRSKTDQWIYLLTIRGKAGFTYTFKVYDHATQQELALTSDVSIAYEANAKFGSGKSLYALNFTSKEPSPKANTMGTKKKK